MPEENNVFCRFDSELGASSSISSVVYKWNHDSSSFVLPVSVDVSHAVDVEHFAVDDKCFLVFTTRVSSNQLNNMESESIKIFQVI